MGDYFETFETPSTSWKLIDFDCEARLAEHERTFRQSHGGQGAEYFAVLAGRGSYAYIGQALEPAHIISELSPHLWVKCNRTDIQLVARIVLPNAAHPRTGEPISFLIAGTKYTQIDRWQQLKIEGVVGKFEAHIRGVRAQFGSQIDPRGAFLNLIALNAYGGPGKTEIWIDALEIKGHIAINPGVINPGAASNSDASASAAPRATGKGPPFNAAAATSVQKRRFPRLQGSVLEVGQRPFLPRVIDYNGESFSTLKAMGINTIRLRSPATEQQRADADAMNLWLVAPPQTGRQQDRNFRQGMLAIDVGRHLTARDLRAIQYRDAQWSPVEGKALRIGGFRRGAANIQRMLDFSLLESTVLGSEFSFSDYFQLLSTQRRQALLLSTPFWATIATEPSASLVEQITLLQSAEANAPNWADRLVVEYEQIRLLTLLAAVGGARGFVFQSRTPLNGDDSAAQLRSAAIELVTLELLPLAPWIGAGEHRGSLETNRRDVHSALFQTERSRLALLIRVSPQQQMVSPAHDLRRMQITIPGVAVDAKPYLLSDNGIQPLDFQRRGGGLQVTLDRFKTFAAIIVSQDPLVINHLYQTSNNLQRRKTQLHYQIATLELAQLEEVLKDGQRQRNTLSLVENKLRGARDNLRHCEDLLDTHDDLNSLQFARRTRSELAGLRRALWEKEVIALPSPAASPCCLNFTALPVQWELTERLRRQVWSANLLPGGTMENLDNMVRAGWSRTPEGSVAGRIAISGDHPHTGRFSLRLSSTERTEAAFAQSRVPVQLVSAPVRVQRGFFLHVRGWVRIAPTQTERGGRLVIYDSEAGPALAVRISSADQWREFSLYRAVTHEGSANVVFEWSGPGEVWIDDLTISQLRLPVGGVAATETLSVRE